MTDDDEFTDELEPLFDYTRVQPSNLVCLDDDDDNYLVGFAKKMKATHPAENEKKKDDVKAAPVVNIDDDDDDWLPPPPKVSSDALKVTDEDSTLKKMRLQKQELLTIAETAKDLLKSVEESAKREICDSVNPTIDGISEKTSELSERATILIQVQDKIKTKQYRVFMDGKFERIVKIYAEKMKCAQNQIVLSFDGEKIGPSETPASLGMEDNDIIEVYVKT